MPAKCAQRNRTCSIGGLLVVGLCAVSMCACTPTQKITSPLKQQPVVSQTSAAPLPDLGKATAVEATSVIPASMVAPLSDVEQTVAQATPVVKEYPLPSKTGPRPKQLPATDSSAVAAEVIDSLSPTVEDVNAEPEPAEPSDDEVVIATDDATEDAAETSTDKPTTEAARPQDPLAAKVGADDCPPGSAAGANGGTNRRGNVGPPRAETPYGNWIPPGIAGPWPRDEYLHDGGDTNMPVQVAADWAVSGLEMTDTVAHFDTLDGRRLVQPSNRVDLYAPRFAAVRTVTRLGASNQVDAPRGVELPEHLNRYDDLQITSTTLQNEQAVPQIGRRRASGYLSTEGDGIVATTLKAYSFQDAFLPFEDFLIMRRGQMRQAEEARLAIAQQAAIAWTGDQEVQVVLDQQRAAADTQYEGIGTVYFVDETPGPARLRVIKLASDQVVKPGETVDFTIRYDNIGASTIGNVTVLDNLTTRLEFVEGSAQSSREADFFTEHNEGGSLILRWEIVNPLEPGEGGLVRFRCRVR